MEKYQLINSHIQEKYLCEKFIIDVFDYYVSNDKPINGDYGLVNYKTITNISHWDEFYKFNPNINCKKVVATNNPNIDLPKVIEEVEKEFTRNIIKTNKIYHNTKLFDTHKEGFIEGFNIHKEQYYLCEQDMIDFVEWKDIHIQEINCSKIHTTKELLQIWLKLKPKTIFYR